MTGRVIHLPTRPAPAAPSPEIASTSIYDGQRHIGSIVERANGQFEAAPAEGASLGFYNSVNAAMHAIIEHDRGGRA